MGQQEWNAASDIQELLAAMNKANSQTPSSHYRGYALGDKGRRYRYLDAILGNGQQCRLFAIDRRTLEVFLAKNRIRLGTVAEMTKEWKTAISLLGEAQ